MKWLFLLALGCDWSLHRMQEQPRCGTHVPTGLLPAGSCDVKPPDGVVALGDVGSPRPAVTRALLVRGRDRFERFCAPCHGLAGDSDSDVARAMTLRKPPTLIDDKAKQFDDDRIFDTITSGYGMMPEYATALAARDRWAIVEYVRVLQSREVDFASLPDDLKRQAEGAL